MSLNKNLFQIILATGFIYNTAFSQAASPPTAEQKKACSEMHHMGKARIGLGIVMRPDSNGNGVNVAAISPKGPAKLAGLQAGDIITAFDGKAVSGKDKATMQQAHAALMNLKEGQSVKVTYSRAGKSSVAVVKASKIDSQMIVNREYHTYGPGVDHEMAFATRWQGLNMTEINPQLGRYFGINSGVLILSPNKSFSQLQAGDVIIKLDGKSIVNPRGVLRVMHSKKEGSKINLEIMRERKLLALTVIAPKLPAMPPPPPMPPRPPAPPTTQNTPPPPPPPHVAMFIDDTGKTIDMDDGELIIVSEIR